MFWFDVKEINIIGIEEIPEINEKDNLASILINSLHKSQLNLINGDVLIITAKIVSKAEGRIVNLDQFKPSEVDRVFAKRIGKDPRLLAAILSESKRIVRMGDGVIISETEHNFICANSGVDQSNVPDGFIALLPLMPDETAEKIRARILEECGVEVAVIISDTFGRPWREGQVDIAIGVSGIEPILNYRGVVDTHGYELKVTAIAVVDELASAAELIMGKTERIPAVLIRNYQFEKGEGGAHKIVRESSKDLFR